MLIIREEQIQHFIARDEPELVKLIAGIIRTGNFERVKDYPDETLEAMTRIGIERAKTYDFERAEDIAAFVAVMFEISPDFDRQEDIKTLLEDKNFAPAQKFEQIWGRVPEEIWTKAEEGYNAATWFPDKQ
ncbi:MAG: hypothetical protein M3033_12555 [Acidobacteriota bacterium]|nr:hypothetical protein [Acidobacteriota bacterium]